jgi:hypothetical protein
MGIKLIKHPSNYIVSQSMVERVDTTVTERGWTLQINLTSEACSCTDRSKSFSTWWHGGIVYEHNLWVCVIRLTKLNPRRDDDINITKFGAVNRKVRRFKPRILSADQQLHITCGRWRLLRQSTKCISQSLPYKHVILLFHHTKRLTKEVIR